MCWLVKIVSKVSGMAHGPLVYLGLNQNCYLFNKFLQQNDSLVKTDQRNHVRNLLHRPKTIQGEKDIHVR